MPAAAPKPDLSEEALSRWLRQHFSLGGSIEPLPGECDLNFKISSGTAESFICKISSGSGGELELLAAQNEVMDLVNNALESCKAAGTSAPFTQKLASS